MQIVELKLRQVTPAYIGGYIPESIDELYYLRPTSLKGIWRWIARALVAGVLYDKGLLAGKNVGNFVRTPRKEEVDAITHIVGRDLGLGLAKDQEGVASVFRITVSVDKKPNIRDIDYREAKQLGIQRPVLVTLGGRRLKYFDNGEFTLKLMVVRRVESNTIELGVRTLILALTIMGVGKGSRRGLGSFDVVSIRGFPLEGSFKDFLNETYKLVEKTLESSQAMKKLRGGTKGLPPLPIISKSSYLDRKITVIYSLTNTDWKLIHNFFLRSVRSRRTVDPLTENKQGWILGIPRFQKATGYFVIKDGVIIREARRASPIFVAVHNSSIFRDLHNTVVITFFTSADWYRELRWKGGTAAQRISINEMDIVNAMNNAEKNLLDFVGKPGLQPLWP